MKLEPGRYDVQLGGLTASFTVLGASNLTVSPSRVEVDQPITVSADLENVAESAATYCCCLLCEGKEVETKDMTIAGGSTETVTFELSRSTPGIYKVELLSISGSFKVLKPAGFEVVSLDILPNPVKEGEETMITITVRNIGEAEDTYTATLALDGVAEQTSDVTLAGGATMPVTFSLSKDSYGSYAVEIGGQEATLIVLEPPPPTGHTLVKDLIPGFAMLRIENRLESDIVVVLSARDEPVAKLAFYVRSGDIYTARQIGGGIYAFFVATGKDWDADSREFLTEATYHLLDDQMKFHSTLQKVTKWTVELGPEKPWRQVSEDEFPVLK